MINHLFKYQQLRKAAALALLFLFALSVTPRKVLHSIIAQHNDTQISSASLNSNEHQLNKLGFNCQIDNLVVESPFVIATSSAQIIGVINFPLYLSKPPYHFFSTEHTVYLLRGPPQITYA